MALKARFHDTRWVCEQPIGHMLLPGVIAVRYVVALYIRELSFCLPAIEMKVTANYRGVYANPNANFAGEWIPKLRRPCSEKRSAANGITT